jgi:acyl-ACP thioesterase
MWVKEFPSYLDQLELVTWCGGVGAHWAERRTRITVKDSTSPAIEAAALWVRVDLKTLKPLQLTDRFLTLIGEAAADRRISARLLVGRDLPADTKVAEEYPWALRFADFDAIGHLNNAVYWEPLEQYLGAHRDRRAPLHATVEHHRSVEPGAHVTVNVHELDGRVVLRMLDGSETASLIQLVTD